MICNVPLTMQSGQPPSFTWDYDWQSNRFSRIVDGKKCEIWQEGRTYAVTPGFEKLAHELFRMHEDIAEIHGKIAHDGDEVMKTAVNLHAGLRLTKNDPWETTVCFLCSINNNIPAIRKGVQSLMAEGRVMSPLQLLEYDLEKTKLGFRKKFLRAASNAWLEGKFNGIEKMGYEGAKERLMEVEGIGPKVADCILLFGYGFTQAFPVDVWILRAMKKYYRLRKESGIGEYARNRWGNAAGHAQQYLYCTARAQLQDAD